MTVPESKDGRSIQNKQSASVLVFEIHFLVFRRPHCSPFFSIGFAYLLMPGPCRNTQLSICMCSHQPLYIFCKTFSLNSSSSCENCSGGCSGSGYCRFQVKCAYFLNKVVFYFLKVADIHWKHLPVVYLEVRSCNLGNFFNSVCKSFGSFSVCVCVRVSTSLLTQIHIICY